MSWMSGFPQWLIAPAGLVQVGIFGILPLVATPAGPAVNTPGYGALRIIPHGRSPTGWAVMTPAGWQPVLQVA